MPALVSYIHKWKFFNGNMKICFPLKMIMLYFNVSFMI